MEEGVQDSSAQSSEPAWKSYPKGSKERKEGLKEWQREHGRQNAKNLIPGASHRVGKEEPGGMVAQAMTEEEVEEVCGVIGWVWRHLDMSSCPAGASGWARTLWKWAHKPENQGEFFSKYVPMLARMEKKGGEGGGDPGGEAVEGLLEEWIQTFKETHCPTCGRKG